MSKGIYAIRNVENNKLYIGYSSCLRQRKNSHFKDLKWNSHKNPRLQNAYNKYGKEKFLFEVIEEMPNASKEELCAREMFYIREKNSFKDGYNCNQGGGFNGAEARKFLWINEISKLEEYLSVIEMAEKYNLWTANLYKITLGKAFTYSGWALKDSDYKNRWKNRYKNKKPLGQIYHLINDFSKREIIGTRKEISKLLDVSEKTLLKTIKKSSAFGWRLFNSKKDVSDYQI